MKFVADAMLGKLARQLRLRGFDVAYTPDLDDNEVIRIGLEQGRIILTRDVALAARPLARNSILIRSDDVEEQLGEVLRTYDSGAFEAALTRCSRCNALLEQVGREDVRDQVPEYVGESFSRFQRCVACGRIYWEGSHVRHLRQGKGK